VQIHEEHNNSMTVHTSGAIALQPTGNIQGSHYFLNVTSGRQVARNNWTALPMPNEIIHTVHRLAAACKKYKGIVFTDSKGKIIDDNSPENDAENTEITGVGNTYPTSSITGVGTNGNGNTTNENGNTTNENGNTTNENGNTTNETGNITGVGENEEADEYTTNTGNLVGNAPINDDMYDDVQEETREGSPIPDLLEIHTTQEEDDDDDHAYEVPTRHEIEIIEEMNTTNMRQDTESTSEDVGTTTEANDEVGEEVHTETGNSTTHGYNLCPRPTRRHEKISLMQMTRQSTCKVEGEKPHLHVLMMQMSVKASIKKFGEKGNEAVSKELQQLHDRKAMVLVLKDEMSLEDRRKALRYLMFIKEKRDGAIKARGCADGRPQRQYTEKGDAISPTVSLEAMMMSCCIDAKEGRYVVVTDIPGAFLHADMNECVHMIMEGTVAEHVAKLELTIYRKYIWHNKKGKPMLYVRLKKHSTAHCKQRYYFGNYYQTRWQVGDSRSTRMTNVWQTSK